MEQHLSDEEISFWRDPRNRGNPEIQRLGTHILKCKECRDRAPLSPAEQFWHSVRDDEAPEETENPPHDTTE